MQQYKSTHNFEHIPMLKASTIIEWHGYDEGALPSSQVASYDGTIAVTHDGRRFNVHPLVRACGGESWNMTLIECEEGAYPIRYEETQNGNA